jgi:integrase
MNTQSTLKHYTSGKYHYIYIYYKLKGKTIKLNTDQQYIDGMHRKDLLYNNKMSGYENLNQTIMNLKNKVDQYITYKLSYVDTKRIGVSQKECMNFIKTGEFTISKNEPFPQPKKLTLIDHYNNFIESKRIELQHSPSLKDYKSLLNALLDYQTTNNMTLTLNIINDKDFFNRFRNYLGTKHKNGKSKGELNNNTVHKRFSSLKSFMSWIEEKEIFIFKHVLYKYKIQKFNTDFVTLNREEIRQLENLKIDNPYWQKIIDVFVCNCFMSLRFGDLQTFDKGKFIQDSDGDFYYQKQNEKTGKTIEVVITPTALKILQKYNFDLPRYTNQYFNRELFTILEHYKLFGETVQKQELRDGKPVTKNYLKRELITSHTCRRSYITNCVTNKVSLNAIQASTGHSQLSTLSKYVKQMMNKVQVNLID